MSAGTKTYDTFFKSVPTGVVVDALLRGIDDEDWVMVREQPGLETDIVWTSHVPPAPHRTFTHHGQVRGMEGGTLLTVRTSPVDA